MLSRDVVKDDEHLARYILTDRWLYRDGRVGCPVRTNAWIPLPHVELSVYRTDDWTEDETHAKGKEVAEERERNHRFKELDAGRDYPDGKRCFRYLGFAGILGAQVRSTGLDIIPKEPPPCHADIVNWPPLTGNRKHDEATQMAFALKIQPLATFTPAGP